MLNILFKLFDVGQKSFEKFFPKAFFHFRKFIMKERLLENIISWYVFAFNMKNLLKELSEACGVAGSESEVTKIVQRELKKCCNSVTIDILGNVIAKKEGKKPSVMLNAHLDEIGLMVKFIDEKGFLKFAKIGG